MLLLVRRILRKEEIQGAAMDRKVLEGKIETIREKRGFVVSLLERTDLSASLQNDVREALNEIDDLLAEYERMFF
jgi:hypothetical protein